MPSYPSATQAFFTDLVIFPSELPAFPGEEDLVIRSVYVPATQTMTIRVVARVGHQERFIAERLIFTGSTEPVKNDGKIPADCATCGSFVKSGEATCGNCGAIA